MQHAADAGIREDSGEKRRVHNAAAFLCRNCFGFAQLSASRMRRRYITVVSARHPVAGGAPRSDPRQRDYFSIRVGILNKLPLARLYPCKTVSDYAPVLRPPLKAPSTRRLESLPPADSAVVSGSEERTRRNPTFTLTRHVARERLRTPGGVLRPPASCRRIGRPRLWQ
ncbi:hypothetical protein PUN28_001055 [Cardiocondyla obscurior]|uniref:Uncharacterized protein n=1 Tax=Cardiocondyla obscurior TaxID=286306 RepID=A0AAW2H368_9HYME